MEELKIAVIQSPRSLIDRKANLTSMLQLVSKVEDASLAIMPEAWLGPVVIEEREYTEILGIFKKLALQRRMGFVLGAQPIRTGDKVFIKGPVISPFGEITGWYEKQFPSAAVGEREFVHPGRPPEVLEYNGWKLGIVVCIDIIYPEIVRQLTLDGAEVIINPANVLSARIDLWRSIGLTRAAENTVYVVMANNTETTYPDGRPVMGGGFIAGPDGTLAARFDSSAGSLTYTLKKEALRKIRRRWKYLEDIRTYPL